jgi:hypothetical protein
MTTFENSWGIHMGERLAQKLVILHLPAYEDKTVFRNVGI